MKNAICFATIVVAVVIIQRLVSTAFTAQKEVPGQVNTGAGKSVEVPSQEKPFPRSVQFTTGYLATSISIPGDSLPRTIKSVDLKCDQLTQQGGAATISFDESEISFDDFGDSSFVRMKRKASYPVSLQAIDVEDAMREGRQLYLLVFIDGRFENRIYLVWSPGRVTTSRLLIRAGDDPLPPLEVPMRPGHGDSDLSLLHMLPLTNQLKESTVDVGEPHHGKISLRTYHFQDVPDDGPASRSQGYIHINGVLRGDGHLMHDRNHVRFTPFGDLGFTTQMGFPRQHVTFKELQIDDPTRRGRRVFKLVPVKPTRAPRFKEIDLTEGPNYSLVLGPTTAGPHRLIIRKGNRIRHVLPMYDPARTEFLRKVPELEQTSDREQRAIAAIRKLIGSRFSFGVEESVIKSFSFAGENGTDATLTLLKDLPNLEQLDLSYCRSISPDGLAVLEHLRRLRSLSFSCTPISDPVLEHVGRLSELQILRFYDEPFLDKDPSDVPHVTDRGLASLKGLSKLQNLSLFGEGISDAGLKHLTNLHGLKRLHCYATCVTPAGLIRVAKQLPQTECEVSGLEASGLTIKLADGSVAVQANADDSILRELTTLSPDVKRLSIFQMGAVTDDGVKHIAEFSNLEYLQMQHSRMITDTALKHLQSLTTLKELNLWYCREITDVGLTYIHDLTDLQVLNLGGTKVTEKGIAELRIKLPNCRIE